MVAAAVWLRKLHGCQHSGSVCACPTARARACGRLAHPSCVPAGLPLLFCGLLVPTQPAVWPPVREAAPRRNPLLPHCRSLVCLSPHVYTLSSTSMLVSPICVRAPFISHVCQATRLCVIPACKSCPPPPNPLVIVDWFVFALLHHFLGAGVCVCLCCCLCCVAASGSAVCQARRPPHPTLPPPWQFCCSAGVC